MSRPAATVTERLPAGWYRIDGAGAFAPGEVRSLTALGADLVVWVDPDGVVSAADAVCPHLGAHLGRAGTVTAQGLLRCGFHGWCYGPDGRNRSSSADGPPVAGAQLRTYPTRLVDDARYVFLDGGTGVVPWEPVAFEPFAEGPPTRVTDRVEDLTAHQQVVLEGDFDLAHFGPVHDQHFGQEPPTFEGATARVGYQTSRRRPQSTEIVLDGLTRMWQRVSLGPVVVGVRADYTSLGARSCRAVTRVSVWAPSPAAADRTVGRLERVLTRDIARDAAVWEHRVYGGDDHLGPDDRVLAQFRRWTRQFYENPSSQVR